MLSSLAIIWTIWMFLFGQYFSVIFVTFDRSYSIAKKFRVYWWWKKKKNGAQCRCNFSLWINLILIVSYTLNKVCDDDFDSIDAESACRTLGYYGGFFETINQQSWSLAEIPILMDNVECTSPNDFFLDCPYISHNCHHDENILLTCDSAGIGELI